jgi:hypothetical protein
VFSWLGSMFRRCAPVRLAVICSRREDRVVAAVLVACGVFLLWKARFLRYPDLAFGYPFLTFDSFQWMVDSLLYRGREVDAVYRNPGLPIVLALLGGIGRVAWLPLVTVGLSAALTMYLVLLLRRHFAPVPTAVAVLLVFFNFSVQTSFDYVLADQWAVTFQVAALYHLLEAEDDPAHLRPFAIWSALSFLFQYAIAVLAPACLLYAFIVMRPRAADPRRFDRNLIAGAALALALVSPLFIYKAVRFGNPVYSGVIHGQLLKPHSFGVVFYALNALAFFGAPAALVSAYGFIRALRDKSVHLLTTACVLSYLAFWVLLYVWLDPRFLLYFVPFAAVCLARGLSELGIETWLGGRGATVPQAVAGWGALAFALLCGLYERSDPYSRNELPLTPQTELVLGMRPITQWEGNVTISLEGMRLVDVTDTIPGLHFLKEYYRRHRAAIDPVLQKESVELRQMRQLIPSDVVVAACGKLPTDYYATMRRELAFERSLKPCVSDPPFRLMAAADAEGPSDEVLFSGEMYRLVRSSVGKGNRASVRDQEKR